MFGHKKKPQAPAEDEAVKGAETKATANENVNAAQETAQNEPKPNAEKKAHKRQEDLTFFQVSKYALKYALSLPAKWGAASCAMLKHQGRDFSGAGPIGKVIRIAVAGGGLWFLSLVAAGQMKELNNFELPTDPTAKGSVFVNKMTDMIEQEIKDGYGPSAAFYRSTYYNINRNAFQRGEMDAWWTVMNTMQQFVMTEGTGQAVDPDLAAAFNALRRNNEWSVSSAADTVSQMKDAVVFLKRYNAGLVKGEKRFLPTIANINAVTPVMSGLLLTEHKAVMDAMHSTSKYNILKNREVYFHALGVMRATHEMATGIFADHWKVLSLQSTPEHAKDAMERLSVDLGVGNGPFSKNAIFVFGGEKGDWIVNDLVDLANDLLRAKDKMDDVPKNFGGAASPTTAPSPAGAVFGKTQAQTPRP